MREGRETLEECPELNKPCSQQCPILTLTLAPLLALPIAAVTIARLHSRGQGQPEDVIAMAKTPSPPPPLTDIAA